VLVTICLKLTTLGEPSGICICICIFTVQEPITVIDALEGEESGSFRTESERYLQTSDFWLRTSKI